ncbi:glycerophosphodiester phosphodiesterase [Paractinoplanes rishiriensis]|uniref:Glycerophosphodiester phosphodiesterase n=1 Tax=Paractinoplanes rishiriensis TaxID=1050105 RepID=A0A919JR09_9ACTN|nr:glycerophosphodiester phosphodiesterase family protein [Actinoplanes rishiriensis]GIE93511.1 glycerophosphodiester phosphodiesterase [Actinoplanes rishiriensis]
MRYRVAHRGYSAVAPENTLPAFAAAVLAGATHVEFDVRTTADGVPMVIHDRTVDRTTNGTGQVWDLSFSEVAAFDAGSWLSPAYAGLPVPTLAATLDLLAGTAPELLLEIKRPASPAEVKAIVEAVAERDLLPRTIVQSFDPDIVRLVREVAPEVRRGLLRLRYDEETVPLAVELGVVCCNPSLDDVLTGRATTDALTAAGIEVMPWTANDVGQWTALVAAGAAGLITDRVAELTAWG